MTTLKNGWRTMDSAPRDGTRVLLRVVNSNVPLVYVGLYDPIDDGWWVAGTTWIPFDESTHWQPLPSTET